MCSRLEGGTQ